jgi:hypothetical protein
MEADDNANRQFLGTDRSVPDEHADTATHTGDIRGIDRFPHA